MPTPTLASTHGRFRTMNGCSNWTPKLLLSTTTAKAELTPASTHIDMPMSTTAEAMLIISSSSTDELSRITIRHLNLTPKTLHPTIIEAELISNSKSTGQR